MKRDIRFVMADLILEKVKEFIKENDSLDRVDDTIVWVDWDAMEVYIGRENEEHPGEDVPICDFVEEVKGMLFPDYDLIDTYAASWRGPER